ncbi:Bax inhibitor-1/YccA family protein [Pseudochryseolinea flava]|uniref:BAX inhibitor (BI)-1/YccA family protein n=1 Tax=Pseudochryseolinea flava TaxID=2059302 RepID=A0A364XZN4_9BACT|nr:Bax inhibitor-1/YccA family protein [Pseudochryseolinea flava]RAV99838.1 BAX inhibitor (BI)-1/YccA family protein [Pseudochryseolinea flava]
MDSKPLSLDQQVALETQRYMVKVYGWMFLGLVITGFVAWYTAEYTDFIDFILGTKWMFFALIIGQIVSVFILVSQINRMSASVATFVFLLYSMLFGLTMSMIFHVYENESIATTFLITAGTFGIMSAWGYTTKTDLTKWGNLLFMGLIALVITGLVNTYFIESTTLHWITSCAGVLIFVGLTAYDTQKIKNLNIIGNEGSDEDHKEAIMGALTLYLDFVNLFLYLLRIFGRRK